MQGLGRIGFGGNASAANTRKEYPDLGWIGFEGLSLGVGLMPAFMPHGCVLTCANIHMSIRLKVLVRYFT